MLLEEARGARDGAAGAHARNQRVNGTLGGVPDLGAGGLVVGLRIGGVHKLARDDGARNLCDELVGLGDGALHALGARGQHDLGTVGSCKAAALDAHGVGHDEDHAVAARGGKHCQANAGVARRGLDDGATSGQTAVLLGRVEHGACNAVLHGAAGVGSLVLAQDAGTAGSECGQVDERGLADEGLYLGCELHDPLLLLRRALGTVTCDFAWCVRSDVRSCYLEAVGCRLTKRALLGPGGQPTAGLPDACCRSRRNVQATAMRCGNTSDNTLWSWRAWALLIPSC